MLGWRGVVTALRYARCAGVCIALHWQYLRTQILQCILCITHTHGLQGRARSRLSARSKRAFGRACSRIPSSKQRLTQIARRQGALGGCQTGVLMSSHSIVAGVHFLRCGEQNSTVLDGMASWSCVKRDAAAGV